MSKDESDRLQQLFLDALEVPADARDEWLVQQCGDDQAALRQIRGLLRQDNRSNDFLEAGLEAGLPSAAGMMLDSQRGLSVRCPNCHAPIALTAGSEQDTVRCDSCGTTFGLIAVDETEAYSRAAPVGRGARSTPARIGQFELLERVGLGAFGSVHKARDTKLDRIVAIKVPRKGQLSSTEAQQFLREARAAAQLRHPNIVSVHDAGADGDQIYIVSDFVEGLTLSDWLEGLRPTYTETAEICIKIARALHHAHEQGVIHRDLKPGNVMLDNQNQPHLMDFGLAKRDAGEVTLTLDGQVLGTPAYMSPEQGAGRGATG